MVEGHPTGTSWDAVKANRSQVAREALSTVAGLSDVHVGSVFRRTPPGMKHHMAKADAYARLVRHLDARLTAAGETGLIVMDGDGNDGSYRSAHRELKLATRSLIEDPFFQHSHQSQWVQMADLVAYTAYMRVARIHQKAHTWDWYELVSSCARTGAEPMCLEGH